MKKLLTFLFFLSGLVFNVHAQNNTNAQSILDKAAAKVQASKGINIIFNLTQKDKLGHVVSDAKGTMKIKGSKYYLKQGENEIFCNGVQIWNYDGDNEVTVAKADNDEELSPQQIITGFNKKDFDIKLLSSAGTNYQIQLIPADKRENYKEVILYVNKSSTLINKAVITDKTNSITEITFSNISLDVSVPDSQFVFDTSKHPGVEVVNQ
ncbi:MAG: outer membrane lipoprotein carrier protein LolA [Parafilimonas sp.]